MSSQTLPLDGYASDARVWVIASQQLADERGHAEVTGLHLLVTGLERDPGVCAVFQRAGVELESLLSASEDALRGMARGTGPAYLSRAFVRLLERASQRTAVAGAERRVGVEDLLDGMTHAPDVELRRVLEAFRLGPGSLRGFLSALHSVPRPDVARPRARDFGRFAMDLLDAVRAPSELPVIARDSEIERVLTILSRQGKRNALLVGEIGVGRGAIVRGLAQRLVANAGNGAPPMRVLQLEVGALLSGARLRAEVHSRLQRVIQLAERTEGPRCVLVIRSLERLLGRGPSDPDLGDLLEVAVARGQLSLVATTTPEGQRQLTTEAPTLARQFMDLSIDEPNEETARAVLGGVAEGLSKHHRVVVSEPAIHSAVSLARRYLGERCLPESAIDLLDEAAAAQRVQLDTSVGASASAAPTIVESHVAQTLARWTGIPVARMLEGEAEKLLQMESRIGRRVIGQAVAVAAVARAVRRSRVGLRDPKRPIGSFLFLGTSGVGKTELAKALAEFMFDDEQALTRLDMSEFMEKHMAQRLVGAPPGYADSEQGGFLTEAVRRRPYSVLLFDEVEKAHPDVFNLLLQVLDEGRLTDGRGRTADFTHTVVIMTSNLGAELIAKSSRDEPRADGGSSEPLSEELQLRLKEYFRPELLNRIGEVVVFRPLDKHDLTQIVELQLARVSLLLAARELRLRVSDQARSRLVELGYDPALGARPLQRVIVRQVQDPLAEAVLAGRHPAGTTLELVLQGDRFEFVPV